MRLFLLFMMIVLSVSCGKKTTDNSKSNDGSCIVNGQAVACDSITGDGLGVDLLESMVDAPVRITDSEITFMAGKTSTSDGRRISCVTTVKSGEVYRYSLSGQSMTLMTPEGNFDMTRKTSGEGLLGTWIWKGYIEQGVHIIRTVTFLGPNRIIMRKTCEL